MDFLPINGTDFVEFYVGNAKQASHYYLTAFGFQPLAYRGLETGDKDKTSYVIRQGKITFILTSSLKPEGEIAEHCKKHGDGVKCIALWVDDATKAFEETTRRGGIPFLRPEANYEIIQRKGARSFEKGNFKALFESIEREQQLRGTL
ncbi:MAG: VOC family protein [Bacteroidales bacterium]|nr:VOC family protein [Bacteroidales bacterium]